VDAHGNKAKAEAEAKHKYQSPVGDVLNGFEMG
jgi:hypothetical protein